MFNKSLLHLSDSAFRVLLTQVYEKCTNSAIPETRDGPGKAQQLIARGTVQFVGLIGVPGAGGGAAHLSSTGILFG